MKEIKKYNKMIEAFECDMTLARDGEKDISELDFRDPNILHDIDLLADLSCGLRYNKLKIVETNKDDVPDYALKTIIWNIIRYATDSHIDGIEFEEVVNDLIENNYMTEDELEKINRGVYNDWLEWKEENIEEEWFE